MATRSGGKCVCLFDGHLSVIGTLISVKGERVSLGSAQRGGGGGGRGRGEIFFIFFYIVCFTSYFVFSIAVLPHSPGVVYYHL